MIVITGMHRSGTSMVSNLLSDLGVSFGDPTTFYATDEWNAKGYFEQSDVMDLNSRLVTGLRRNVSKVERLFCTLRYTMMPKASVRARRTEKAHEELERLAAKYADHAVKDPRFCLTLGAWRAVAEIDRIVVCLRHPLSVAHSLRRRQRYPLALGYRFWNYHFEGLFDLLRDDDDVVFVDYDRLAGPDHAEELDRLRVAFAPDLDATRMEEIHDGVFDARLRHFSEPDDSEMPSRTAELWRELRERHSLGD